MAMVEKSIVKEEGLSKCLYRIVLYLTKMVPVLISIIYLLNTILSYLNIDLPLFSYLVQYLFIILMYASSYAFRFCLWHRLLIHYILIVFTLNIIDYHVGIPLSDRELMIGYSIFTGIFLIAIIYLKFKVCKH
jgi:hypothetical protein